MSVGGDGNKPVTFTSRTDIARYVCYVLTHLPAEQLKNRAFTISGDTKVASNLKMQWCLANDKPLNRALTKCSKRTKKGPGRSCRSLMSLLPNMMQDWLPIRRTLLLSCRKPGLLRNRSSELITTCIPTGIRRPRLITCLLRKHSQRRLAHKQCGTVCFSSYEGEYKM